METTRRKFLLAVFSLVLVTGTAQLETDETTATQFLANLDPSYLRAANTDMKARWQYITDVTDENGNAEVLASNEFLAFQQETWKEVNTYDWSGFTQPEVKREFEFLNIIGPAALTPEDANEYNSLGNSMETTYSTAKICPYDQQNCGSPSWALEPELTEIMATSDNYDELQYVWVGWHNAAGRPIRKDYQRFVELNNKAAVENHYDDMGSLWNAYYLYEGYSEDDFKAAVEELWQTVKPLYQQLYTYVRRVLNETVFPDKIDRKKRLPAHVFGNMWAQDWGNLGRHVLPYPEAPAVDATPAMIEQGYDAKQMFELADAFFQGMGFDKMTDTFWKESMIEKPADREVVCHASAEEFFFGPGNDISIREDFRIKMCTTVTQDDLVTVHHEMGHIQYFMRYKEEHWVFRNGANPGFHEAIGDTIALAVSTPAHLQKVGLLPKTSAAQSKTTPLYPNLPALSEGVSEQDLNYLMSQALNKIAFIPFGYLMDKWRWSVFDGTTTDADLNAQWWNLRNELQGIVPPVTRTENDFDPGAKYHIPANVEYIRYFVSYIIQFQFYEALCTKAGQYDPSNNQSQPLYKCDFDGSKDAGTAMMEMMNPGFSKPWPDSLEALTGSRKMDATSLIKYFEPLKTWLEEANAISGECIGGWECDEDYAHEYMAGEYETTASSYYSKSAFAEWDYETNVTTENEEISTAAYLEAAAYRKETWEKYMTKFQYETFADEDLKRQFQLLQTLGTPALPEEDQKNLSTVINNMIGQYSTAKICPYDNQNCKDSEKLSLEPDIEELLVTSNNYDELSYLWSEWRRVASKPMRHDYEQYVELNNKAAELNGLDDMGQLWVEPYYTDNFTQQLEAILEQTKPFYDKLHAYTRMKLRDKYGKARIDMDRPPIPQSILGNMWAQTWENLYDLLVPYPEAGTVDVTDEMVKEGWNVTFMFETAEEFYTSLGLEPMPTCYGPDSMIEKPTDREVVCHASAWDFSNKVDYRIKMCTNVNMVDLITVHHEQGHIQYYEQYKDLPITFRDGANPGFHEAIGDVMSMSVSTPGHLSKIGLIPNFVESDRSDYNYLMRTALEKATFLPFAFVMDRWRWGVFSGEFPPEKWMQSWMMLTEKYQGIVPPVMRHNDDFDPGAKYHIAADVEYSRYFVANVLTFQLHKSLCITAKQYEPGNVTKPLYRCDIYQSPEAGAVLKKLLQSGSSRPWEDVLQEATGQRNLDASAILEFFKPLDDYISFQLNKTNELTGWRSTYQDLIAADTNTSSDNTVPIIVGSVLAAMVIVVIIAYFVGRSRNRKKQAKKNQPNLEGHDNPAVTVVSS